MKIKTSETECLGLMK